MGEPHVISGLKAKAHEIRMRISELEGHIKVCRRDLATIGEALRVFGDPDGFYIKPEALFSKGDLARAIFDALRENPKGLQLPAIVEAVAKVHSLDMNDTQLAPLVRKRVTAALYRFHGRNEITNQKMRGGMKVWKIMP
jgi:hypothetical protein